MVVGTVVVVIEDAVVEGDVGVLVVGVADEEVDGGSVTSTAPPEQAVSPSNRAENATRRGRTPPRLQSSPPKW